jgi:chemotaxis protein methyltransferase CheR
VREVDHPAGVRAVDHPAPGGLDLEGLEVELILEAICRVYGLDFRGYSRASIRRRLRRWMGKEGAGSISGLQERVLHDTGCMSRLLQDLSVSDTEMFRDPPFFRAFREKVVPALRTYPFVRIWTAGCATGEETYSLAIVLQEEGLYERARVYATDMNEGVLDHARAGEYPITKMREYTRNYIAAGGTKALSAYYRADGTTARFHPDLAGNVIFAQHNLVSDRSFNEFNAILCRNVMIYFDRALQEQVHGVLYESLAMFGVLGLGARESIKLTRCEPYYEELDDKQKLYRKVR